MVFVKTHCQWRISPWPPLQPLATPRRNTTRLMESLSQVFRAGTGTSLLTKREIEKKKIKNKRERERDIEKKRKTQKMRGNTGTLPRMHLENSFHLFNQRLALLMQTRDWVKNWLQ